MGLATCPGYISIKFTYICEVIYVESQCWEEDTWSSSQDSVQDKSGIRLRMETALLLKI